MSALNCRIVVTVLSVFCQHLTLGVVCKPQRRAIPPTVAANFLMLWEWKDHITGKDQPFENKQKLALVHTIAYIINLHASINSEELGCIFFNIDTYSLKPLTSIMKLNCLSDMRIA